MRLPEPGLIYYDLSPAQQRMWLVSQDRESSVSYNVTSGYAIEGALDTGKFRSALAAVIARHESLRSNYSIVDEGLKRRVNPQLETDLDFKLIDISDDPFALQALIDEAALEEFDIENGAVLRGRLFKTGEEHHLFILVVHHIAADGHSFDIIMNDLFTLYGGGSLPEFGLSYAGYIDKHNGFLSSPSIKEQEEFWLKQYSTTPGILTLPYDFSRPAQQTFGADTAHFRLSEEESKALKAFATGQRTTLFVFLLSVLKVVLHKLSGQDDLIVGVPFSGRKADNNEHVGMFVNTLPLRSRLDGSQRYKDYLKQLTALVFDAYDNQDYPFEELFDKLKIPRDLSRNPVFDVMFVLHERDKLQERCKAVDGTNLQIRPYKYDIKAFAFDLLLEAINEGDEISFELQYSTSLFKPATIERLIGYIKNGIHAVLDSHTSPINDINLLSSSELAQLVEGFNATEVPYDEGKTILDLFGEAAAKHPERTAVVFESEQLSYKELDERSNQLARYLQSLGVKPEMPVPICLERSLEMIVGILGILKAGGAYVPIDPGYPSERIGYMLEDIGSGIILTGSASRSSLPEEGYQVIELDTQWPDISRQPVTPPASGVSASHLAYIIYTSGSTGRPKGVMIEHAGIYNRLQWAQDYYRLSPEDTVLQKTTFCFDVSVWELIWPLLSGSKLVFARPGGHKDSGYLKEIIAEQGITMLHFVPSMLEAFLLDIEPGDCPGLKQVLCSGEALKQNHVRQFREKLPHVALHNLYGPTEASIDVSYWSDDKQADIPASIPIGKPVANTELYILDPSGNPVPVGVTGELHIGGVQVARGYLNRPELTEEKFVASPFKAGGRLYRTGDLARWLSDGNIEYLGRIDDQVKIRGYRVELGEIENVLLQSGVVNKAVVLVREDKAGYQRLVAYLEAGAGYEVETIRRFLSSHLPEYMVPSLLVEMDKIPLTGNGKVDKKALPEVEAGELLAENYAAPETPLQEQLVQIWETLLGTKQVGIQHNFFELGGHSLLAVRMILAIRQQLGKELSIKEVFVHNTIKLLAAHLEGSESRQTVSEIKAEERPARIPLSYGQERLWFIDQLEGSVPYHIPLVLQFHTPPNAAALGDALKTIVTRHEALRTVIEAEGGEAYQRMLDPGSWQLDLIADTGGQTIEEIIESLVSMPFNLATDYKLRAALIENSSEGGILVITMHHIASDGRSVGVLMEEMSALYAHHDAGQALSLAPLPVQYADYSIWQRGQALSHKLDYWQKKLSHVTQLALPADYVRPAMQSQKGATVSFAIEKEIADKINTLCGEQGATPFMVFLAAFKVLLHKYSGQNDICVGSPVAGRHHHEIENLIGFFVNTIAIRSDVNHSQTFAALLQQVKETLLEAYEHQDVPFEEVVRSVVTERDMSRAPLFQVMFVLQNASGMLNALPGIESTQLTVRQSTSKFDIVFNIREDEQGLHGIVEYSTDLYSEATIHRMAGHYKKLLSTLVDTPLGRIRDINLLSSSELAQLVEGFNATEAPYDADKTILDLFGEAAAKNTERTAVVFEGEQLSYTELDERSSQLAHYLQSLGVKPEMPVPVCLERSLEMIVGILGILKAGGAYVPIDPGYPSERIGYMLEDIGSGIILTTSASRSSLPGEGYRIIELDTEWAEISRQPVTPPASGVSTNHLAYVIYTSGSTGRPKGVMIEHAGIYNRLQWAQGYYRLSPEDTVLQKTTFCFDVSVWELIWPLLNGSKLVFARPGGHKDSGYLKDIITKQGITMLHFVPSMLEAFLLDIKPGDCPGLKQVLCSGEALKQSHVRQFREKLPHVALHNLYGPTEASIEVTHWKDDKQKAVPANIPIGKPIANTQLYILDANMRLCPLGVTGELYIGGVQVARGYLNRLELTEEKFVASPFKAGGRLYRTGDLARWLSDGNIEYLGRIDDQVKIRGYRVELGEIENVLLQSGVVNKAVVLAKEDKAGYQRLVAYLEAGAGYDAEAVRGFLSSHLPEYMVPSLLVEMDKIPLTGNGKVDKKALLEVETTTLLSKDYAAPETALQEQLVQIWETLLGTKQVGIHHNFFELGGHSLLAVRLILAIRQQLGKELSIKEVFVHNTIKALSTHLELTGVHYDLSPAQQRMWLVSQDRESSVSYNVTSGYAIEGTLDTGKFRSALAAVIARHESLRSNYSIVDEGLKRRVNPHLEKDLDFKLTDLSGDPSSLKALIDEAALEEFDIENGAVLRGRLFKTGEERHLFILVVHHIAADGHSFDIIMNDLFTIYGGGSLPEFGLSYADYIEKHNGFLSSPSIKEQEEFWLKQYNTTPGILTLPYDFSRPAQQTFGADTVHFKLSGEESKALKAFATGQRTTLFVFLLSVLKVVLHQLSGQDDLIVGVPFSGRKADNNEHVGMFVNTLPLRSRLDGSQRYKDYLKQLTALVFDAYDNQDYPFEELFDKLKIPRDLSRNPVFDVMFSLHEKNAAFDIPGLGVHPFNYDRKSCPFDLLIETTDSGEGISFELTYNTGLFKAETISRFMGYIKNCLTLVSADPAGEIKHIDLLSDPEKQQLLEVFNSAPANYDPRRTILDLFEEEAGRNAEKTAVVFENQEISYKDLDVRSNQLAHYLQTLGVAPEMLVPICIERSIDMVVGVLGILKAGAAYVPIDPEFPSDRISYMLDNAGATIVLSSEGCRSALPAGNYSIVEIDTARPEIARQPGAKVQRTGSPENLVYVLYTSGSTGKPKGVKMTLGGVTNLILWQEEQFRTKDRHVLQFANLTFDVSFQEIFSTLCSGSTLYLISPEHRRDIPRLTAHISAHRITHLFVPYIVLQGIAEYIQEQPSHAFSIEEVIVAGEQLKLTANIRDFLQENGIRLINQYGPTEAHVVSSYTVTEEDYSLVLPPIGKPIANTQLYILDANMRLCPLGVTGELYIGGIQVARGYLNRPELTEEKFVASPFKAGGRLYRTGDLARWLSDGNIEYLGRIDDQVKIRGYRVELGEIENVLLQSGVVNKAVVLAREDKSGYQRLVAYVEAAETYEAEAVKRFLSSHLPEYMVPSLLVEMDKIPLTGNGKVDKKALPEVEAGELLAENYAAPETPLQEQLVQIWETLLGTKQVGIQHNFFELGGHSLLAVRMILAIRQQLGKELNIKEVFVHNTIKALAAHLEGAESRRTVSDAFIPPAVPSEFGYPLSFAQERLWFIGKYEGGNNVYNIPLFFKLAPGADKDLVCASIKSIVERHEILRSLIKTDIDGNGYQTVQDDPLTISETVLDDIASVNQALQADAGYICNLEEEYPFRAAVYRLNNDCYISITVHHIAFDGWSVEVLMKELGAWYAYHESVKKGSAGRLMLPDLSIQYKDFAAWQKTYLSGDKLALQLSYWKEKLRGFETLNLPADKPRPPQVNYRGDTLNFELSETESAGLRQLARELNVSLYSVLLGGCYLLLKGYSNQNDIVVGTLVANRNHSQLEDLIGFFVNSLALRCQVDGNQTLSSFISQLGEDVIQAQLHQDLPFEKLVQELELSPDPSRHPVFQVLFNAVGFGLKGDEKEALPVETYKHDKRYQIAKFDLSIGVDESSACLRGYFNYSVSLFNRSTIECMADTYVTILRQLSYYGGAARELEGVKLSDIRYLDEPSYEKVIEEWNQTSRSYPSDKTIHGLFSEQAEKTPDAIALVLNEERLTYKELNERSNQLAHYLQKNGVQRGQLVPVCIERSTWMMACILGVLKAGAAYVPIDPGHPEERIEFMLKDAGATWILSSKAVRPKLGNNTSHLHIIEVDGADAAAISAGPVSDLQMETMPDALAYVIYTSGSTGRPKGVLIEHRSVVNYIHAQSAYFNIQNDERILQFTNFGFDPSVEQIFLALFNGASLVLLPEGLQYDTAGFEAYLRDQKITHLHATPVFLENIAAHNYPALKRVIAGGDTFRKELSAKWRPHADFYNKYGPTETTISAVEYHDTGDFPERNKVPIGRPIQNMQAYVLDEDLRPLPVGATGELYIGGSGVARGYLNRPELTSERFIASTFIPGERLYRTGDLVRWLPDGNLEYIGRNDFQVKIRGYRIELGEIESVLESYPGITRSAVLALERPGQPGRKASRYLAGYFVSGDKPDEVDILAYVSGKLPEYMVPTVLVQLESLPLTANGKLDRKALPEPELRGGPAGSHVAPRTELESQVCQIYAEVLGVSPEQISVRDDFFRIGGDSIVSIQVVSRLRRRLNLSVSVKDMFTYRSIEQLCAHMLSSGDVQQALKSEQGLLNGPADLLPIQEWFFRREFSNPGHWNHSFLIRTPALDKDILELAIGLLTEYHDVLRFRYNEVNSSDTESSSCTQYYLGALEEVRLHSLDVSTLRGKEGSDEFAAELSRKLTQYQSSFDLKNGPVYAAAYLSGYADGSSRVFLAFHHLVVDTVSWRILKDDLQSLYNHLLAYGANAGGEDALLSARILGPKGSSYRQWVESIRSYASKNRGQQAYWQDRVNEYHQVQPALNVLAGDEVNHVRVRLDKTATKSLLTDSHRAYHTQINDLLLAAFGMAVGELTGESACYVVLEGHGRQELDPGVDITRTVGWFTAIYPVRLSWNKADPGSSIKSVKEELRSIPDKGIGFGALMGYSKSNLPKISFNYLGRFDQDEPGEKADWAITGESSGIGMAAENTDDNLINANGLVLGGELQFDISTRLKPQQAEKLARAFKEKLEQIIHHAGRQERSYLTVSDIDHIIDQDYLDSLQEHREISQVYLANSLQQGFIYHALNQGDVDDAYHVQLIWDYQSRVDPEKLRSSWEYAQARFPSLRLRLAWDDEPVQVVDAKGELDWRYIDLSDAAAGEQDLQIRQIRHEDRLEKYDLRKGGLFRVYLIKKDEDHYTCLFSHHHAIMDGWSNPVLQDFVHACYHQLIQELPVKEFQTEQSYGAAQAYLQQTREKHLGFWNRYIARIDEYADLAGLLKPEIGYLKLSEYKHVKEVSAEAYTLSGELYRKVKEITYEYGITVNAILQYVWHRTLSIYGNTQTTVVGTTVSGRNLPVNDIEHSVGLFINTLPLIVEHDPALPLYKVLQNLQADVNEINERSNIPLSGLQPEGRRLFDSLFIYENYPSPSSEKAKGLTAIFREAFEKIDYPLSVVAYEHGESITFQLNYAAELFDAQIIGRLLETCRTITEQLSRDPEQPSGELRYISDQEYAKVIAEWNNTAHAYASDKTIHKLFSEQAFLTPERTAVVYGDLKLSYRELDEASNRLARYLQQAHGIGPDDLVGLLLDRSEHMLVAILGVLKAGGAYVPIDPGYPSERLGFILGDTDAKVVLTNGRYVSLLTGLATGSAVVEIDSADHDQLLQAYARDAVIAGSGSANLAYVIYTSGTTGKPKGVMIEHFALVNYINFAIAAYNKKKRGVFPLFTSISFDLTMTAIFTPLLCGNELVIYPEGDAGLLLEKVFGDNLSDVIKLTPSHLKLIRDCDLDLSATNIKTLIVGGEELETDLVKYFHDHLPKGAVIYNEYGPTESTVGCIVYKSAAGRPDRAVPIGRPIWNTRAYVLDANRRPLPAGAIGELYIGGTGLSRGYLNRRELTSERFIASPFIPGERLYKTGDLVRWRGDGEMEYLGRNDFQVKIRGYRIELGEIENQLAGHANVKQAIVLANINEKTNEKYLCAYILASGEVKDDDLHTFLLARLPEYMVPSVFVFIDKIPVTQNGKLDRKALPKPKAKAPDQVIAPRNETEAKLVEIWSRVLNIEKEAISIESSFFELGGYSIKAVVASSIISKEYNVHIPLAQIFKTPKIKDLAVYITNATDVFHEAISVLPKQDHYPASSAQKRIFFIEQLENIGTSYNSFFILKFEGELDRARLEESYRKLIRRHESLRTSFRIVNDEPVQVIHDEVDFKVEDLGKYDLEEAREVVNGFVRPFNLSEAPLVRAGVIELNPKEYLLLHDIHHIITDGSSRSIFINDLTDLYDDRPLSDLKISYKDFASWQNNLFNHELFRKKLDYWLDIYSGGVPVLNLQTDYPRTDNPSFTGDGYEFSLAGDDLPLLRAYCKKHEITLFMYLLATLNVLLNKYSGQEDIVIGNSIFGRPHADLHHIMGMFVNKLAIRAFPEKEKPFTEFIREVKQRSIEAFDNQEVQFEEIVDKLKLKRSLSRNPLFDVSLAVQNFERPKSKGRHISLFDFGRDNKTSKFDISIFVAEANEKIYFYIEYRTDLFKRSTIQKFADRFLSIIRQGYGNENLKIKDFQLSYDLAEMQSAVPQIDFEF